VPQSQVQHPLSPPCSKTLVFYIVCRMCSHCRCVLKASNASLERRRSSSQRIRLQNANVLYRNACGQAWNAYGRVHVFRGLRIIFCVSDRAYNIHCVSKNAPLWSLSIIFAKYQPLFLILSSAHSVYNLQ